jgi:hypothetical protein
MWQSGLVQQPKKLPIVEQAELLHGRTPRNSAQ